MATNLWTHMTMSTARSAVEGSNTLGEALDKQPFKDTRKCSAWNDLVVFMWLRKEAKDVPDFLARLNRMVGTPA